MVERSPSPAFYVQIDRQIPGSVEPQFFSQTKKFVKLTPEHLQQVGEIIATAGAWVTDKVQGMATKPSSCSLEFGINLSGEVGIPFVTKGTIEANFKVCVEWKTEK